MDENVRAELIDGELYMMAPPVRAHRRIQGEFHRQIGNFLIDKSCEVYLELGVRLFDTDDDSVEDSETLVIPDITVVCDHSKLDDVSCKGAPDFIIEILSPSSAKHDKLFKLNLYSRAKVREYWIVDPYNRTVDVLLLDENEKLTLSTVYSCEDTAKVTVLPGCEIDLSRVFPEPEVPQRKKQ